MTLRQQIDQILLAHHAELVQKIPTLTEQIDRYLKLIEKWNKVYNLTAIISPSDMLYQHIMDSLSVLPHIRGNHVVDVGSGAGLPGLPVALARPEYQVTLIESNQKKTTFLQQVKIELDLKNVSIIRQRIEDVQLKNKHVDTIISRAFASLGDFVQLTGHLSRENRMFCRWLAMKSNCSPDELNQVKDPYAVEQIIRLNVPGLDADRQLIVVRTTDV